MFSTMRFLLINGSQSKYWHRTLKSALSALGEIDAVEEKDTLVTLSGCEYSLVFVDATAVAEPPDLVEQIRSRWQDLPVVVASAMPQWEQARKVMMAGATNYISKSYNEEELREVARKALNLAV
ncbi:MAG: response regulator [Acidobacteria bacterium]|nr:response regulator [Acidobacteriota bacterium]